MELLKLLSANELVAQAINFLLLLAILRIFLWKRFLKILDDRRERLASEYKNLEDSKKQLDNLRHSYEEKIASMDDRARSVTEEAIVEGKKVAQTIIEEAEHEAKNIIENSREMVKLELVKARQELKDEIVELTIIVTEKVIEDKLTEGADKKLIEGFLDKLDKVEKNR